MVQKSSMSRTPSTSTQEIQMDMFDQHPHAQVSSIGYNSSLPGKSHCRFDGASPPVAEAFV